VYIIKLLCLFAGISNVWKRYLLQNRSQIALMKYPEIDNSITVVNETSAAET